jgi:hypothetical protein
VRKNQRVWGEITLVRKDGTIDRSLDGCSAILRAPNRNFKILHNTGTIHHGRFVLENIRFQESTLSVSNHDKMDLIVDIRSSHKKEFVWPKAIKVTADGTRYRGKRIFYF